MKSHATSSQATVALKSCFLYCAPFIILSVLVCVGLWLRINLKGNKDSLHTTMD